MDAKLFDGLLKRAEEELGAIRRQRVELERSEKMAVEKVAHIRALIDLCSPTAGSSDSPASSPGISLTDPAQIEDVAASILGERGPLHYKELYAECERRGTVVVSSNPSAVLLTRILRDPRFRRAEGRGRYRLAEPGEHASPPPSLRQRRRRKRRQRNLVGDTFR